MVRRPWLVVVALCVGLALALCVRPGSAPTSSSAVGVEDVQPWFSPSLKAMIPPICTTERAQTSMGCKTRADLLLEILQLAWLDHARPEGQRSLDDVGFAAVVWHVVWYLNQGLPDEHPYTSDGFIHGYAQGVPEIRDPQGAVFLQGGAARQPPNYCLVPNWLCLDQARQTAEFFRTPHPGQGWRWQAVIDRLDHGH